MSAGSNRRRPTRMTVPYHAQAVRLIDSAADHTWSAVRVPKARAWHKAQAVGLLELARSCRSQVGPVLP